MAIAMVVMVVDVKQIASCSVQVILRINVEGHIQTLYMRVRRLGWKSVEVETY